MNVFVLGISTSVGAGGYVSGSLQIVVDLNGNVGVQFTYGTGVVGGLSGDGSIYAGGYYTPSIYSIEGFGLEEGVTGGDGIVFGGGTW